MTKRSEITSSMNNSSATSTSTHETGTVKLTGNPYTDLSAYGVTLHGCAIRYLQNPNQRGNTITGRFNISGREETAGATTYEALIHFLVHKYKTHCQYIAECRTLRKNNRYPIIMNHCNVTINNYQP